MNSEAGQTATDARGRSDGEAHSEGDPTDAGDDLTEGGYIHRPNVSDAASGRSEGFGRKGWLLVAAVVFATLVVPGYIYLRPALPARLGFGFRASMLVLPLVPALLLGLVAVWSMTAAE